MPVLCVDLSRWDGNVSIPKLKEAGVGAVIAKCGGGDLGLYEDSKWEANYANCKAASMPVGAYWYMGATTVAKAKEEAAHCIGLLEGKQFEYPIYVDVEEKAHQRMCESQPATLAKVICAITDALREAGYYPGVYSWKWLLEPCGSKVAALEWWVCAWTRTKPCDCGMWQFGGETNLLRPTTVAGYPNMDQSYAYRDYPAIIKAAGLNGFRKEAKVALSIPEIIAQVAKHYAEHNAHGYSQYNREGDGTEETITLSDGTKVVLHGGDIDCSEMVRICVNCALSGNYAKPITFLWTGNEDEELRAHGFRRIAFAKSKVKRGDILLRSGHTGVAMGDGKQAEASHDENYGLGGKKGDQTGTEVAVNALSSNWTYIYRYEGDGSETSDEVEWFDVNKTIEFAKGSYVRTQPKLGSAYIVRSNGKAVRYEKGNTVTIDGLTIGDGYVWGTYIGGSGNRRYVALGPTSRVAK